MLKYAHFVFEIYSLGCVGVLWIGQKKSSIRSSGLPKAWQSRACVFRCSCGAWLDLPLGVGSFGRWHRAICRPNAVLSH